jgi:predicted CXXCH cytochrome family protein
LPRQLNQEGKLTVWWDNLPSGVQENLVPSGPDSNIHPGDYAGPDSCKTCHPRNYATWARHPHRWMNALASKATVKGDFSNQATISYLGGQGFFRQRAGRYEMELRRGQIRRTYVVTQTIGSRFYQYYVGKLIDGPEPRSHHFYTAEHVLPFGYWLPERQWVPIVHVGPEMPDGQRPDPFTPPDQGRHYAEYAASCNDCHTTFPLADLLARSAHIVGTHAPVALHWSVRPYLKEARPALLGLAERAFNEPGASHPLARMEAPRYAATLGVSCEACHLGAKAHVERRLSPGFFPSSPYLLVSGQEQPSAGRTHDNVNWSCGRCHTGKRPQFAGGMSTWNSVEYSDAMRGSCYSKLRCIDCHDPHQALGPRWTRSPDKDDAVCLKCHQQLQPPLRREQHTHHPAGSPGARCMNCHMPRINEGIQDVVRTHMIYSPTRADMIEANHPNACNLCHTDQPIDWTLGHLKEWYAARFDDSKIAASYPNRGEPVVRGWLRSDNPAVRLVAVETLTRARDSRELPLLLDALDDPQLLNRQFACKGLQKMLKVRLSDFGYKFYMSPEERREPLTELRRWVDRRAEIGR